MLNFRNTKVKNENTKFSKRLQEYKIEGTIGEGTYGKVKNATHISTNESVAIKFINKNKLIRAGDSERIQNEMKIIENLNHPNILKAFEIFDDEFYYYIVMERPGKGDLFNYICNKRRLTLDESTYIFYQIVNGISYLQEQKIIHRDLKPENIMLTDDMIVKIGDFGLSKYYTSKDMRLETNCGSPCYSAPEMLRGNKYKPIPIDVWGMGIILYCMLCGQLPFEDEREDVLIRKVTQCEFSCPYYINLNVRNLLKRILCPNPNNRISMDEIKKNFVYNMGKANFLKFFKIYGDDGDLLPQVKRFVNEKSLHSLEVECSMEISKDSKNTTAYKIFYYKFMHKTNWNEYLIPKRNEENVVRLSEDEMRQKANKILDFSSKKNSRTNSQKKYKNINKIKEENTAKNYNKINNPINEEKEVNIKNDNILFIPEHETLSSAIAKLYPLEETSKINLTYLDIEAIRKMGILSHSFDANWVPKSKFDDDSKNIEVYGKNANVNKIIYGDVPKIDYQQSISEKSEDLSTQKEIKNEKKVTFTKVPFKV